MTARVHSRHSRIGAVFGLPGLLWWSLCGPVMAQAPTSAGIAQPATAPSISTARTPVIALATAPTHTGVHTSALPSEAPPGAAAAAQRRGVLRAGRRGSGRKPCGNGNGNGNGH
jgi:hypothetical protein